MTHENESLSLGELRINMQPYIVSAVREEAAKGDPQLQKVVAEYDAAVAAGKNVEIRLNPAKKSISVVEIEEVTLDLTDAGEIPDAELEGVGFVYMDEPDPEYDAQAAAA